MEKRESAFTRFRKWIATGKVNKKICIITFMIVPVLLLVTFTYLPFLKMVQFSFFKMKYIGAREFIGLQNYKDVFSRSDCFQALKLSLYYMVASFVQLALALWFASILSRNRKGDGVFKGFIFIPYLVCGIAVGFIFKFFFARGFVLDTILGWFGFDLDKLPFWLQNQKINNISLAATSVWRYMGQNMVLFIGAIMSVDSDLYEAAEIDGAGGWNKFRYITFPSIKTIVVLNMILAISGSLSAFEPPYVITKGQFGTATYFVVMDRLAHVTQKVGLASAMAIVLFAIIVLITLLQKAAFAYFFGEGQEEAIRDKRKRAKMQQQAGR